MHFSKIVFCIAVLMLWASFLYAQPASVEVPAQDRVSLRKEAALAVDTVKAATVVLPETIAMQNQVTVPAGAWPDSVRNDKTEKYGVSDWSSFWGAVLGAVISAAAAIFVFQRSNCVQRRNRRRMLEVSFGVILELLKQTVDFLERFMKESEQIKKYHEKFHDKGEITPLPFNVPYALKRLKHYDMGLFSEVMAEFHVDGYSQLFPCIDHTCHYIDEVNEYFRQKDDELRTVKESEQRKQVYEEVLCFVQQEGGLKENLDQAKETMSHFLENMKIRGANIDQR